MWRSLFSFLRYVALKYRENKIFSKENMIPMILTLAYVLKIMILNNLQKIFIIIISIYY